MSRVARSAFVSTPGLNLPLASRRRGVVTPRAARPDRRPENAPGDFFVDHTCIDCDACRWIAPDTFTRVGGMSAVTTQPRDANTRATALRALLSCPTSSIHLDAPADEVKRAHEDFLVASESPRTTTTSTATRPRPRAAFARTTSDSTAVLPTAPRRTSSPFPTDAGA